MAEPLLRSGMGATNYYAALRDIVKLPVDLPAECTIHVVFFTDGHSNTGRADWDGLFAEEVQPQLARRPGSNFKVWYMGKSPPSRLRDITRPHGEQSIVLLEPDALMAHTKLVAGRSKKKRRRVQTKPMANRSFVRT